MKNKVDKNAGKYSTHDIKFLEAVQSFAETQINLDKDFTCVLNELINSKIGDKPIKQRF